MNGTTVLSRAMRTGIHKGFTLLEMLVAIVVASLLMLALSEALAPAVAFYGKQETVSRLNDMRLALETSYKDDAPLIDSVSGAIYTARDGVISQVLPVNGQCNTPENTFLPIARYLPTSAGAMSRDGHSRGFCVFITPRQSFIDSGVTYHYRTIAVVSSGYDGAIDPSTSLSSTGVLTLGGDDKGVLIDGKKLITNKVQLAMAQLEKVSTAISSYFRTRYLSTPSRDVSINYFANRNRYGGISPNWDANGSISNTGGQAIPITSGATHEVLGLSLLDVTDPWGGIIHFDNSSDNVRNPDHTNASRRLPGYTARLHIRLPSGELMVRTIVGSY